MIAPTPITDNPQTATAAGHPCPKNPPNRKITSEQKAMIAAMPSTLLFTGGFSAALTSFDFRDSG